MNACERPLEVAERDPFADAEPFDLVEHRRVPEVVVVPVDAPGADDADRRLARQHRADLHRRSVRAQQPAVFEEESVLRVARRMVVGKVEETEVHPVVFDLGPFGDAVTQRPEDRFDLTRDESHRMQRATARAPARQRHVDALGGAPRGVLGLGEGRVAGRERRLDARL